jgi:hypothetical protein
MVWKTAETTKYVLEISAYNGQATIIMNEVTFLWENPEDTLVFQGKKGAQGPQGFRGPPSDCFCD